MVVSKEHDFETVSTLRGCGGLERTNFEQVPLWEGGGSLERTGVLTSIYFGRVW